MPLSDKENARLKSSFLDISRGYSQFTLGKKTLYLKHISFEDNIVIDDFQKGIIEICDKESIPSEEERLIFLNKRKLWTIKDEKNYEEQKRFLKGLESNRLNSYLPSQIDMMDKTIADTKKVINDLFSNRYGFLDMTRERFIDEKMNRFLIFYTLYKDSLCQNRYYDSFEEFDDLDDEDLYLITLIYNGISKSYDNENSRKIVVSDFFLPYFMIYIDNVNNIFGEKVQKGPLFLTYPQIHFIVNFRHFKSILTTQKIPDSIRNNPDEIDKYVTLNANMKAIIDRQGDKDGYTGVVASSKDLSYFKEMDGKMGENDKLMQAAKHKPIGNVMEASKIKGI